MESAQKQPTKIVLIASVVCLTCLFSSLQISEAGLVSDEKFVKPRSDNGTETEILHQVSSGFHRYVPHPPRKQWHHHGQEVSHRKPLNRKKFWDYHKRQHSKWKLNPRHIHAPSKRHIHKPTPWYEKHEPKYRPSHFDWKAKHEQRKFDFKQQRNKHHRGRMPKPVERSRDRRVQFRRPRPETHNHIDRRHGDRTREAKREPIDNQERFNAKRSRHDFVEKQRKPTSDSKSTERRPETPRFPNRPKTNQPHEQLPRGRPEPETQRKLVKRRPAEPENNQAKPPSKKREEKKSKQKNDLGPELRKNQPPPNRFPHHPRFPPSSSFYQSRPTDEKLERSMPKSSADVAQPKLSSKFPIQTSEKNERINKKRDDSPKVTGDEKTPESSPEMKTSNKLNKQPMESDDSTENEKPKITETENELPPSANSLPVTPTNQPIQSNQNPPIQKPEAEIKQPEFQPEQKTIAEKDVASEASLDNEVVEGVNIVKMLHNSNTIDKAQLHSDHSTTSSSSPTSNQLTHSDSKRSQQSADQSHSHISVSFEDELANKESNLINNIEDAEMPFDNTGTNVLDVNSVINSKKPLSGEKGTGSSEIISPVVNIDSNLASGCPVRKCTTNCLSGVFKLDSNTGCPSCRCCPKLTCTITCAEGLMTDGAGCPVCRCSI